MSNAWLKALVLVMAGGFALAGCDVNEGPVERAGENIDEAAEETGEAVEGAVEWTGEKIEEGGDEIRERTQ